MPPTVIPLRSRRTYRARHVVGGSALASVITTIVMMVLRHYGWA